MTRPDDLTGYLFIGGPEDGKRIATPGLPRHEVAIEEPPRLRAPRSGLWAEPRAVYHRLPMIIDKVLTHVYVIDGMGYSEARERVKRVRDADSR